MFHTIVHPSSACPRGAPFMMCLANPCEGSSCPANPKAKCRANSCGHCTPQFFDDNDNLVDCATSKYQWLKRKKRHYHYLSPGLLAQLIL